MIMSMAVRTIAVATAVGLVSVGMAGAARAADPGVSKTEVVIGTTTPLTGPASPGYKDVPVAAQAYFDYVNKSGGINGRQIKYIVKDDQYNPAATVTKTNELILNDKIFAMYGALGTANHLAVVDEINKQGMPDIFVNTGSSLFDNVKKYPTTFPYFPSYLVEAKVMAYYIKNTPELASKKRCFMYQEGEFGENAGVGFSAAGMTDWAAQASYLPTQIAQGFGAQVTKLKAAGCELVVFFGVTSATGVLFRTMAALSFKPTLMVTSVGSEPTIISGIVGSAAAGKAALNGVYTPSFLTPITDVGNPYVSQMKTLADAAGLPWNFYTYYGMNTAYVLSQAIKAAGPNLTRKGLIKAIQTQGRNFKSAAVVPFVVSATSHQGLTGYWMGKYDSDGVLVRQGKANQVYLAGNSSTGTAKVGTFKQPAPTRKLLP